jgi:hypothetical protein
VDIVVERCAGLDVAKDAVVGVCPHAGQERAPSGGTDLSDLHRRFGSAGRRLAAEGVSRVVMGGAGPVPAPVTTALNTGSRSGMCWRTEVSS